MLAIKKIIIIMLFLSSNIFAVVTNSASSTITVEAISIPNISVSDIVFNDYVIGDVSPASQNITVTITDGAPGSSVKVSIGGNTLELTDGLGNSMWITMLVHASNVNPEGTEGSVTLDGNGGGTTNIEVSFQIRPTVAGTYTGNQTVTIQYN